MTLGGCYYYPHLIGESIEIQESQSLDSHTYIFLSLQLPNTSWLSMLLSAFPPRLWEPWNEGPVGVPNGALLDHRGLGAGKCSASPCRISQSINRGKAHIREAADALARAPEHCPLPCGAALLFFLKLLLGHYSFTRWKWGVSAVQSYVDPRVLMGAPAERKVTPTPRCQEK